MTATDDLAAVREACEQHSHNLSMEPTPFQLEQAVNFLVTTVPRSLDRLAARLEEAERHVNAWRTVAEDADGVLSVQLLDAGLQSLDREKALEARLEELEAALRDIFAVGSTATGYDELEECIVIARSALGEDKT